MSSIPVQTDEGLRERGFGDFQGKTFAEIEVTLPEQALLWRKRDPHFAPAGGESLIQFRERAVNTVNALAAKHPGEQIVVVAHGGVMDLLYRAATGQDLQAPRTWQLGNASINRLLWTPDVTHGGLSLVGWSDTFHLDDDALRRSGTGSTCPACGLRSPHPLFCLLGGYQFIACWLGSALLRVAFCG